MAENECPALSSMWQEVGLIHFPELMIHNQYSLFNATYMLPGTGRAHSYNCENQRRALGLVNGEGFDVLYHMTLNRMRVGTHACGD